MREERKDCRNMNHGKLNPPIHYCPNCGEKFKSTAPAQCNLEKHNSQRKNHGNYCVDCGKKLR